MNLKIHKDRRNTGKFHHKAPSKTNSKSTRALVMKEITKYTKEYGDFGECNYLGCESLIVTKLDPYTTYVYEDLYQSQFLNPII